MVKRGSICNHPERREIDQGLMAAVPYRTMAAQYGLSPSALCRHAKHLTRALEAQRRHQDEFRQAAMLDASLTPPLINTPYMSPSAASANPSASFYKKPSRNAAATARSTNPEVMG